MAMYSLNLMRIALELAMHNHVYEDIATKFFEHFLHIAEAMSNAGESGEGLWDSDEEFFYDVLHLPDGERGWDGAGIVHHVAWRTPDDDQQLAWQQDIATSGLRVTPVMDRQYFRSIYFREPGGVLFEIATDPPGFLADESEAQLGSALRLPPWLEPQRRDIERILPKLDRPGVTTQ